MPIRLTLLAIVAGLTTSARAQDEVLLPSIPAKIDLQDGDTLVFLGDSITHQRLYTQYVEDFFYQRFPDRRIRFHNAGVGGAQAWDALARTGRDVLNYRPRYVTILLGMNDGRYQPFNKEIFTKYQGDMTSLVKRLRQAGATPILMSPTMFDTRAVQLQKNPRRVRSPEMLSEYNSVLAYYGRWLQHVAGESGLSYVDMYGPMNDLTMEQRKTDPKFTMVKDAVHPDAPGQVVMAYAMIDDLGLRRPLSGIRIQSDGPGKFRATASGGRVTNLKPTDRGLEFDWTAAGLPWILPEEAHSGVDMLRLGHRATKEALEVHGLIPGDYELVIDDIEVGRYSNVLLSRHVELQGNSRTPQYQQAMKVAMLNKQKNEGPVRQLRDGWRAFQKWARLDQILNGADTPDEQRRDVAPAAAAARLQVNDLEQKIKASEAAAAEIEDEIYKINQPVTRHYVLRKVDPPRIKRLPVF